MSDTRRVGLLGGTFDPVHNGHLAVATVAAHALHLTAVRFIPSAHPPHRPARPRASAEHRLQMLARACEAAPHWEVSTLELRRSGPSFTVDTLRAVQREGLSPTQIFFIIGADAFAEIATWHEYPEVLAAAHFIVVTRPGATLSSLRLRLPELTTRMVEATEFDRLAGSGDPRVVLLEANTPAVSSTDIRRRVAEDRRIDHLVPAAVAAYIVEHRLYRAATLATTLETRLHG